MGAGESDQTRTTEDARELTKRSLPLTGRPRTQDGSKLISVGADKAARMFDLASGQASKSEASAAQPPSDELEPELVLSTYLSAPQTSRPADLHIILIRVLQPKSLHMTLRSDRVDTLSPPMGARSSSLEVSRPPPSPDHTVIGRAFPTDHSCLLLRLG